MELITKKYDELLNQGRWDIDFTIPPKLIKKFPANILKRVDQVCVFSKESRNPADKPDELFQYVDISSIDVFTGQIVNSTETEGRDAPSRARKVIRFGDIIISTCRPTRGAIAIVPPHLDNQICSTGFVVVHATKDINTFYLHSILRYESTLEQFRKFSTGASYPAILEDDIKKTLISLPSPDIQDGVAKTILKSLEDRNKKVEDANNSFIDTFKESIGVLKTGTKKEELKNFLKTNPYKLPVIPIADKLEKRYNHSKRMKKSDKNQKSLESYSE